MSANYSSSFSFMESDSITNFHNPRTFHDRTVVVDGKKFYIQSGLLSVWSEFFRGLFNSDFKEKNEDEVKVEDVSAVEFETFLRLVHGELFEWKEAHYEQLLRLSDRFLAPKVLTLCRKQIEVDFDKIDKPKLLDLACTYGLHGIKKRTLKFIEANDDFRQIPALVEVAFKHNLEETEALVRSRDEHQYYEIHDAEIKENSNPPKKMKFSGLDLGREKLKLAKHQDLSHSGITMEFQNGAVDQMDFYKHSDQESLGRFKSLKNLPFSESVELINAFSPKYLTTENADVDDAIKCWSQLKELFSSNCYAIFKLVGHGDMWDYNIRALAVLLTDVIAKIMQETTDSLFIEVSKTSLRLTTYTSSDADDGSNVRRSTYFRIDFVYGWNSPTFYATLFPLMLKDLENIKRLYISFDLPCKNSIDCIFKHMKWTFQENSVELYDDYYKKIRSSGRYYFAHDMLRRNVCIDEQTETQVTYFFVKRAEVRDSRGHIAMTRFQT